MELVNMCRQNLVMFWQLFKQRKMVGEFSYHVNQGSLTMSHRCLNKSFGLQGINVLGLPRKYDWWWRWNETNPKVTCFVIYNDRIICSIFFWLTPIYPSKPSSGVNSCRKIFLTILCLPEMWKVSLFYVPISLHETSVMTWSLYLMIKDSSRHLNSCITSLLWIWE